MNFQILVVAIIILLSLFFNKISSKLGIPALLVFIALGMVFGVDGIFRIPFDDYSFAEDLATIALIFIMFYGGFGTKYSAAKVIALRAIILSSLGTILTALTLALLLNFIIGLDFLRSFLIGSVLSATDAASVFSILRSKRLNLKSNTASILEIESGSNDPFSYMLTLIAISIINTKGDINYLKISSLIVTQLAFGLLFGFLIAYLCIYIFKKIRFESDGSGQIFVVSAALLSYSIASLFNGNGFLSTYIVGILLGNKIPSSKKSLVSFFDGITSLMQMMIFFVLGLLANPKTMISTMPLALIVAALLTFIARPIAVSIVLSPFKAKLNQQTLIAFAGLRGASSIVFSILAITNIENFNQSLFNIVFLVVLFSLFFQGSLLSVVAKWLKMIDNSNNVMKTFNDYSNEVDVQFITLNITNSHPYKDKMVKDVQIPNGILLVLIIRDSKRIIPTGLTYIYQGDQVVFCAKAYEDSKDLSLKELKVDKTSEYKDKRIAEVAKDSKKLIILIKRDNRVVIPRGNTLIAENDILIIHEILEDH